ncbi:Sulfotransferase domain protein [Anatilimnocola aggregata]|uniref:Sulfotransferase domain protein n=2 Tax=Anatilimnocola aggregata TaxID=2528021 RepID=A0A517YCN2_9BACT|nr:Sulfotransferase domain protein [Anatilimnocola aggregata]
MTSLTTPSPAQNKPAKKPKMNDYPWYSPRFWHALRISDWCRLLARHGFRVHPFKLPMAAMITATTPFNSAAALLQHLWFGSYIERTRVEQPPVFIVGHWRSGTTLLHELLHLDSRFATPNTYQCMAPHHTFVTEWLIGKRMGWLVPKQRPMDNMAAGFQRPQEDEFALLALGAPTPYARMAFPNDVPADYSDVLNLDEASPADVEKFRKAIVWFAKLITLQTRQKQLLLKSPPHTGRIGHLAQWFPGAKFIHIARSPFSLFPSTTRLWESLDDVQGLQVARHKHLREYVFDCFERMYRGYEKQRNEIPAGDLYELKYEDLVKDPVGQCEQIYERLQLGNFAPVRDKIAAYMQSQKDYQTNKHQMDAETEAEIRRRWAGYFSRFGYE